MRADLITTKPIYSSFLSLNRDIQKILKTLFVSSRPYSDRLKRLLIINNKDCLDMSNDKYQKIIDSFSLSDMIEKNYIKLDHKVARGTHEEIKTYMTIVFDSFSSNPENPAYLDYNVYFDIICNHDAWVLNDYQIRPIVICGYIDGILTSLTKPNNAAAKKTHQDQIKIIGPGNYEKIGCHYANLNQDFGAYVLAYRTTVLAEDIVKLGDIHA